VIGSCLGKKRNREKRVFFMKNRGGAWCRLRKMGMSIS